MRRGDGEDHQATSGMGGLTDSLRSSFLVLGNKPRLKRWEACVSGQGVGSLLCSCVSSLSLGLGNGVGGVWRRKKMKTNGSHSRHKREKSITP